MLSRAPKELRAPGKEPERRGRSRSGATGPRSLLTPAQEDAVPLGVVVRDGKRILLVLAFLVLEQHAPLREEVEVRTGEGTVERERHAAGVFELREPGLEAAAAEPVAGGRLLGGAVLAVERRHEGEVLRLADRDRAVRLVHT